CDDMASSSGGTEDVVICINCRQSIQYKLHVKCCECPAIICIDCFSYGCEAGSHVRGHNYEICDPLGGRTFDAKGSWGAIEEKKLLAAAYRYKLGNWGEVTKLMETNRPISEVQEYYDRFFIRGPIGQLALKKLN
ncbi:LisH protein, partial [Ancylostoma duodenale]